MLGTAALVENSCALVGMKVLAPGARGQAADFTSTLYGAPAGPEN